MIEATAGVREFILALADDEHLMGQQHTEWIGVAPFLEEDLAFSSIGQDELGHAALLYELLAGDDDLAIDELAYGRGAEGYRSCWLVELITTEWNEALVRHWLYDSAEHLRWQLLTESSIPDLAAVALRAEREEVYHRRHANGLLDVLLDDTGATTRIHEALTALVPLAGGMFEGVAGEAEAVSSGVAGAPFSSCRAAWHALINERFGVDVDSGAYSGPGPAPDQRDRTQRSSAFAPLMSRMREVLDYDPAAVW